jgi:cytochrome c biogenesis protein
VPEQKKSVVNRFWGLFASVKFAIVIFSLIALTSIVGTVLEQRAEPARNIVILSKIFGETLGPTVYSLLNSLGFMDMYHSWWFRVLLVLFSTNLIICSLDRLPRIWKLAREPIQPMTAERLEMVGMRREVSLKGKPEKVRDAVTGAIKAIGFSCAETKEERGYQFYSQKGSYTRLGVYLTHLSIILILAGALIGISFGFKGFMNIPEGRTYPFAFVGPVSLSPGEEQERERMLNALEASWGNVSKASGLLGMKEDEFRKKLGKYGVLPLGFSIRCDNFDVEFYANSQMPKEYKSWLTVIDDGKEVERKSIEVNDPLTYKGITFYQANYGTLPNTPGLVVLKVTSNSGASEIKRLNIGESFTIPGTDTEGTVRDFSPALSFDQQGKAFTFSEMMNNPAVFIDFREGGKEKYAGWILKRYPETWKTPEGYTVQFVEYWGVQYTGLQVRKDPGVGLVYFGSIVMTLGLFIAFFMSHRKLWVRIVEDKGNAKVTIGASTNKNRTGFERKIEKMVALLKKSEGGK